MSGEGSWRGDRKKRKKKKRGGTHWWWWAEAEMGWTL